MPIKAQRIHSEVGFFFRILVKKCKTGYRTPAKIPEETHPKCVCKSERDLAYRNFIKLSGSYCDVVKSFFPTCEGCGIGKASSRISILISLCFSGGSRPSEKKGGGGSSRPLDKGEGLQKNFFRPLGPQSGLKIKWGQVPLAPPLDPPLCFIHLGLPVI